jgi:hypothetical protein
MNGLDYCETYREKESVVVFGAEVQICSGNWNPDIIFCTGKRYGLAYTGRPGCIWMGFGLCSAVSVAG